MIVFAHGLESAPQGAKTEALKGAGLPVEAPDCQGRLLAERITIIDEATRRAAERGPVVLAGSSYGGLAAAWLATQHPKRFAGLLLFAPALEHCELPSLVPADLVAPKGLRTLIVHGRHDRVVPIEGSRRYQQRSGAHVELIEVDDDHRLGRSLDIIIQAARRLHAEN